MGQMAIGVDRQLPGRTQLSINYVNTRGVHVLRERDINAPVGYIAPPPNSDIPINPGVRPFAGTGVPGANEDIYQYETSGIFKQTQLTVNANTRLNSHLQVQGYYVFGEAHTNVNGTNGFPMNQYNDNIDWGRAPFDARHRGYFGGAIGLPLKLNLNPFVTMQSGFPFNIITGQQFDGDGITTSTRPYFAPCTTKTMTKFGCFSASQTPGYGLVPMDYGDGPAQFSVNLRLSRTWGWGERAGGTNPTPNGGGGFGGGGRGGGFGGGGGGRGGAGGGFGGGGRGGFGGLGGGNTGKRYNLTATITARNAFNHVNYAAPDGVLGSPFFGESTALNFGQGAGFGGNNGAAGNRKVEMQLRFQF
jgi:hypothetical protein